MLLVRPLFCPRYCHALVLGIRSPNKYYCHALVLGRANPSPLFLSFFSCLVRVAIHIVTFFGRTACHIRSIRFVVPFSIIFRKWSCFMWNIINFASLHSCWKPPMGRWWVGRINIKGVTVRFGFDVLRISQVLKSVENKATGNALRDVYMHRMCCVL